MVGGGETASVFATTGMGADGVRVGISFGAITWEEDVGDEDMLGVKTTPLVSMNELGGGTAEERGAKGGSIGGACSTSICGASAGAGDKVELACNTGGA